MGGFCHAVSFSFCFNIPSQPRMQFCLSWRGRSTVCLIADAMLSPTVEEELPFSSPTFFVGGLGSLSSQVIAVGFAFRS